MKRKRKEGGMKMQRTWKKRVKRVGNERGKDHKKGRQEGRIKKVEK